MKHVVCLRWGDAYSDEYVDNLKEQLDEHLTVDFQFHSFTEEDLPESNWAELSEFYQAIRDPRHYTFDDMRDSGGLSHFRKLQLFGNCDLEGDIVYMDLDVKIQKNIDWLFDLDSAKPWLIKNYWFAGERFRKNFAVHRSPMINSSVVKWTGDQMKPINTFIDTNIDKVMFTYNAIDNFIQDQFCGFHNGKPHMFNYYDKGRIVNFSEVNETELEESDIITYPGLPVWVKEEHVLGVENV